MNRTVYSPYATSGDATDVVAAFTGAGASAPTVTASSATADPTKILAADNFAASATRSATGTYVLTLKEKFPEFLHVMPEVLSPTGNWLAVTSWSTTAGTISVQAYNAAGTAADLTTSDIARLRIYARGNRNT